MAPSRPQDKMLLKEKSRFESQLSHLKHTVLVPPRVGYTGPHDRQMKPRHEPRTVLDCLALLLTGPIEFLYHKPSHTSSLSHSMLRTAPPAPGPLLKRCAVAIPAFGASMGASKTEATTCTSVTFCARGYLRVSRTPTTAEMTTCDVRKG